MDRPVSLSETGDTCQAWSPFITLSPPRGPKVLIEMGYIFLSWHRALAAFGHHPCLSSGSRCSWLATPQSQRVSTPQEPCRLHALMLSCVLGESRGHRDLTTTVSSGWRWNCGCLELEPVVPRGTLHCIRIQCPVGSGPHTLSQLGGEKQTQVPFTRQQPV